MRIYRFRFLRSWPNLPISSIIIHPLCFTYSCLSPFSSFLSFYLSFMFHIFLVVPSFILPFFCIFIHPLCFKYSCLSGNQQGYLKQKGWMKGKVGWKEWATFLSFYSSFMFQIFLLVPFYPYFLVIFFLIISNIFKIKKNHYILLFHQLFKMPNKIESLPQTQSV